MVWNTLHGPSRKIRGSPFIHNSRRLTPCRALLSHSCGERRNYNSKHKPMLPSIDSPDKLGYCVVSAVYWLLARTLCAMPNEFAVCNCTYCARCSNLLPIVMNSWTRERNLNLDRRTEVVTGIKGEKKRSDGTPAKAILARAEFVQGFSGPFITFRFIRRTPTLPPLGSNN